MITVIPAVFMEIYYPIAVVADILFAVLFLIIFLKKTVLAKGRLKA